MATIQAIDDRPSKSSVGDKKTTAALIQFERDGERDATDEIVHGGQHRVRGQGRLRQRGDHSRRAARGQDARSEFAIVQLQGVLQPRTQNRRRTPAIFRRSQHQDHVRRLRFLARALPLDAHGEECDRDHQTNDRQRDRVP